MDLIIRNVSVDEKIVDIGIKQEKIVAVSETLSKTAIQELDAGGRVAIPGFVDTHLHLDKSMLNEAAAYKDVSGPEKGALTRELKENFTVEDIKNRAERVIQQAIKTGALYLRTNVDVDGLVGVKGIEALLDLKKKYEDVVTIQVTAFSQEGFVRYPETYQLLEEALEMGADLVGGHTIMDGDKGKEHIDKVLQLAKKYDVPAEFHVDESGDRDHYLLPYLCKRILEEELIGKVIGIHNCTLTALSEEERKEAFELIKASDLKITIAPTAISTRQLAPVKALLSAGIPVALGSDNVRDFFNPLGSGDVKQVALLLSYIHRFFTQEETEQIWNMITKDGAHLINIEEYGIVEGYEANITILDETSPKEVIAKQAQPYAMVRKGKEVTSEILEEIATSR